MRYPNDTDFFCPDLIVGPVVWGVFCVPCVCVGLPVSVWLLWVLKKQCARSSNVYMLNLTVMDLLFNLALIPTLLNSFVWRNVQFWLCVLLYQPVRTALVYGVYLCGLVHGCGPPHLIHEHTVRRGTHRLVLSVLVWALTLVYGYVMVYITPLSTILALSVSAPVIVFCNLSVLCALRKPDPTGKTEVHPQKQRALQVIINSLVVTIATYPPMLAVSAFYGMVNENGTDFFCKVMIPSLISPTVGSTIMPVLYLGILGALRGIRTVY